METKRFSLKEIVEVLENEEIKSLEVGHKVVKDASLQNELGRCLNLLSKLQPEWKKNFNDVLSLKEFRECKVDCLKYIKEKYIKKEGFDEKLPFVKKDKLMEIVDFPDFSVLTGILYQLITMKLDSEIFDIFKFEDLFELEGKTPPNATDQINQHCKVLIKDRKTVESYLYFLLYVRCFAGFNGSFKNMSWVNINQRLLGSRILSNVPNSFGLNINTEELLKRLDEGGGEIITIAELVAKGRLPNPNQK